MKTITASRFKAQALALLDEVSGSGEEFVITKRGHPVARIIPCHHVNADVQPGWLASTLVRLGDIVTPLGADDWEAAR